MLRNINTIYNWAQIYKSSTNLFESIPNDSVRYNYTLTHIYRIKKQDEFKQIARNMYPILYNCPICAIDNLTGNILKLNAVYRKYK